MNRKFTIIAFFLFPSLVNAQSFQIAKPALPVDSLEKALLSLSDSARVDCLNKLSLEYYKNALPETYINVQTDTAASFASQAYSEAEKINYTRGIADALQNLGEISRDRNDYVTAEKYFSQSVPLFEKLNAAERYSWANLTLGWSLHQQWKFSEAKSAYERAMPFCITSGNKERESMLLRLISYTYSSRGYNEIAFEYMLKAIRITYMISDPRGVISSPQVMANIYKSAGDIATALAYFRLAAQNAGPINPVRYYRLLGEICNLLDQKDSAEYYYNESNNFVNRMTSDTHIRKKLTCYGYVGDGESYLRQKKYTQAIENFKRPWQFFEKGNDKTSVMRILKGLAKCYQAQRSFTESLLYTKQVLQIALETGARPFERDADELYWKIYDGMGKTDSAYKYNLKYTVLKDSIMSDEYRRNIAVSEMKAQDEQQKTKISLLQKDHQFDKDKLSLQQQKLKNELYIRYILIAMVSAFVLIGFFIFRNINLKRKNEKTATSLQKMNCRFKNSKAKEQKQNYNNRRQNLKCRPFVPK